MKELFFGSLIVVGWASFIYGGYWIIKSFSYWFFYESMVQGTIMEVLKTQGLL